MMTIHNISTSRATIAVVCRLRHWIWGHFSTASKQSSKGDDTCCGNDPTDDLGLPGSRVRALEVKACQLEKQVRDLTEQYNKAMADSDLVRRRTQKFVEDAKLFGIQSFCRDLVDVVDLLEQTTKEVHGSHDQSTTSKQGDMGQTTAHSQGGKDEGQSLDRITAEARGEGLEVDQDQTGRVSRQLAQVQARLQEVFSKHGLEKMQPIGSRYDPYQHQIVCHTSAHQEVEPSTIALVKQEGYILHGRTIRHALVGIAVATQGKGLKGSD
ncbi:grpE protein homolog 2, mitochondrial isoform X2 [Hypomesus transpacificus]|uniref:grpE protein homolog 2, mitochondrial isoform X2 n=1 Tax=Hypomesus transpacificus TaxID=137520 RepID=UPI001F078D71|nr:grpE protein homolog 2, mitochondrial isoform X2 [Hypomesus transpacificus]